VGLMYAHSEHHAKRKVVCCIGAFVLLLVVSYVFLLNDFESGSKVDLSPLSAVNTGIENFGERHEGLRNTIHFDFARSRNTVHNYRFLFYGAKPDLQLTIYEFDSLDRAFNNLLISSGARERDVKRLSDTVFAYHTKSRIKRDYSGLMDKNLHRRVETYFTVGEYLFVLRETGDAGLIGTTTNDIIALIIETFINE
jgi:hypothetical protein